MTVKAIAINDKFFFWRCEQCEWESERLPVSSKNLPPAHECVNQRHREFLRKVAEQKTA